MEVAGPRPPVSRSRRRRRRRWPRFRGGGPVSVDPSRGRNSESACCCTCPEFAAPAWSRASALRPPRRCTVACRPRPQSLRRRARRAPSSFRPCAPTARTSSTLQCAHRRVRGRPRLPPPLAALHQGLGRGTAALTSRVFVGRTWADLRRPGPLRGPLNACAGRRAPRPRSPAPARPLSRPPARRSAPRTGIALAPGWAEHVVHHHHHRRLQQLAPAASRNGRRRLRPLTLPGWPRLLPVLRAAAPSAPSPPRKGRPPVPRDRPPMAIPRLRSTVRSPPPLREGAAARGTAERTSGLSGATSRLRNADRAAARLPGPQHRSASAAVT